MADYRADDVIAADAARVPDEEPIFGTTLFDGAMAQRGFALNAMCFGFNDAAEREAFRADEQFYCRAHGLDEEQCRAVADKDVLGLIAAGGNIYYLAKLAGIWGLNVQQLGAAQTGMSVEEFKAMLVAQGRQERTAA